MKKLFSKIKRVKNKRTIFVLSLLFIITFAIRLYISFQNFEFNDDESYFALRQIEHIKETGLPGFEDPYSYGGKTFIYQPFLYYLIALPSIFFDTIITAKIIINLISVLTLIIVFLITKHITKKDDVSIFTTFISAFTPLYFLSTTNSITSLGLSILFSLLLIYNFLNINKKKHSFSFVVILVLYILTDPSVILTILTIILYLFLSWIQGFKITKAELEVTIFSTIATTWSLLFFFKDAFKIHGIEAFRNNTPKLLLESLFSNEVFFDSLLLVGIIPLLTGIGVIYLYIFYLKKKDIYFLIAPSIMISILLILNIINTTSGLLFLSVFLIMLLGEGLDLLFNYTNRLKFKWTQLVVLILLSLTFLFGSVLPTINISYKSIQKESPDVTEALNLLEQINVENAAVASSSKIGHQISYKTRSPNIMDSNYMYTEGINNRYNDLKLIFTSATLITAIDILNKYNANYIVFTDDVTEEFGVHKIAYDDHECFPLLYNSTDIKLYHVGCRTQ